MFDVSCLKKAFEFHALIRISNAPQQTTVRAGVYCTSHFACMVQVPRLVARISLLFFNDGLGEEGGEG